METTLPTSALVRRSVSLPGDLAAKLEAVAGQRRVSVNRVIADFLADALAAYEQRRSAFLDLADRFQKATNPDESARLREELARITFGG